MNRYRLIAWVIAILFLVAGIVAILSGEIVLLK